MKTTLKESDLTDRNPGLPVIKFDNYWNIVEAIAPGVEFLDLLGGIQSEIPPSILMANYPCITQSDCCVDICITLGPDNYYFSAVAFPEAGYLGLYAYRIVYREAVPVRAA
jgi:hypothetical protein